MQNNKHSEHIILSKQIIGTIIKDNYSNEIGTISDIVLDKLSGNIKYIIFSNYSKAEFENKQYALGWKNLIHKEDTFNNQNEFLLNISEPMLRALESIDPNSLPDNISSLQGLTSNENNPLSLQDKGNCNNKDQLKSLVLADQQQIKDEIFVSEDGSSFNSNASEQQVYPGIQPKDSEKHNAGFNR